MQLAAATPKVNPYHNMHELFRIMKFGGRRGRGSKLHLKNDFHTIVHFGAIFYACERMQLEITDGHLSNAPPCASVGTDSGVPYHLEGPTERENLGYIPPLCKLLAPQVQPRLHKFIIGGAKRMRFFDESAIEWWLPAAYLILYLVFFAIAQVVRRCRRSTKSVEQDALQTPLLQDGE